MKTIKLFASIFLLPLYLFSMICPRSKNIWVFGSWFGDRYSDSSRYLFEYVVNNEKDIRAIWLTRDKRIINELKIKGHEVYHTNSLAGYWYTCRASVAFFTVNITDINTLGASRILKFQLWHGVPLKKIVYDDDYNNPNSRKTTLKILSKIKSYILPFKNVFGKWDVVVSTSPLVSDIFKSAFKLPENRIFVTGTPRSDVILCSQPVKPEIIKYSPANFNIKRRISFFPTHRLDSQGLSNFINSINESNLPEFLESSSSVLYIKLHYFNLNKHIHHVTSPRIILLNENDATDINYLLPWTDVLITDYSSVYFDYLLLNRPIIFTPFDVDDYLTKDRKLYGEYHSLTPGPKCMNWTEVTSQLRNLYYGLDEYENHRIDTRNKYHTYSDTHSSQRIVKVVRDLIGQ